jgi:predicted lysophospholipase L1 biosynthesis ABC-type transport system permease subunit
MMGHSPAEAAGKWRRWIFRVWIAITLLLAGYIVILLPFVRDERIGPVLLGVPVPLVMILLTAVGLGWLVWLVTARRRRARPQR